MTDSTSTNLANALDSFVVPYTGRPLGGPGSGFELERRGPAWHVTIRLGFTLAASGEVLAEALRVHCAPALAGAPIDTDAGEGAVKQMAHDLPMRFFEEMVNLGNGRMPGSFMLAGWKNMHPEQQYVDKYLDLYTHIEDRNYVERTEAFERWYENPVDLPGTFYLQAVAQLFKENRLAKGTFGALGRNVDLRDITMPLHLVAGEHDDITPRESLLRAESLVGTPKGAIEKTMAPGGHIGLFMSRRNVADVWPAIGRWILAQESRAAAS